MNIPQNPQQNPQSPGPAGLPGLLPGEPECLSPAYWPSRDWGALLAQLPDPDETDAVLALMIRNHWHEEQVIAVSLGNLVEMDAAHQANSTLGIGATVGDAGFNMFLHRNTAPAHQVRAKAVTLDLAAQSLAARAQRRIDQSKGLIAPDPPRSGCALKALLGLLSLLCFWRH